MMITRLAAATALLAAGFAQAQTPLFKFDGAVVELWYTQMLDNSLRYDAAAKPGGQSSYYDGLSSGRFQENSFAVKRTEMYFSGALSEAISWNVMFDPNNADYNGKTPSSSVASNVLQDALITWVPIKGFTIKAGQFKMPTTYEATIVAAKDIYFFDRNQLNRQFGDKRDRGVWLSYAYGDAKGFQGKVNLAVSNGTTDLTSSKDTAGAAIQSSNSGKGNDTNAQKDWTFRFEGGYGPAHKFGFYYRVGRSDQQDWQTTYVGTTIPAAWTTAGVTIATIKDNADKTTLEGLYYAYDDASWHADVECATGLLGRRFPTLFSTTAVTPLREHLDQKFLGYAATVVYKLGAHWLAARYDFLNYNSGDKWYTAYNPYTQVAGGGPLLVNGAPVDYTPKYSEITLGYNYLFAPTKQSQGKLKLDYIIRSKNFLVPGTGAGTTGNVLNQHGEQGGNSLVASLEVGF